jgi:hypothetical protein
VVSNKTITPNPPTSRLGYPSSLFFAISDTPPNPAPIIRSIVAKSYASTNFEFWELASKDCSYNLCSVCALSRRFAIESVTDLSAWSLER